MASEFLKLSFVPAKTSKVLYRNAEKIVNDIDFKPKNQHFFCFLAGDFVYGDFIEAMFEKTQFKTDELIISTLSLSSVNIRSSQNIEQLDIVDSKEMYNYSVNFLKNSVKYHKNKAGKKVSDDYFKIDDLEEFDGFKMEF